jgi:hypothetical protein
VDVPGVGRVEARIRGTIDRIDKRTDPTTGENAYYVIDYKSGKVTGGALTVTVSGEMNLKDVFSHQEKKKKEPDYSKVRQLLIYTYLYLEYLRRKAPQKEPIQLYAGIYSFLNMAEEVLLLKRKVKVGSKNEFFLWDIQQEEQALKEALEAVIKDMLDVNKEIKKVEDESYCKYCDYKVICQRKVKERNY